MCNYLHWKPRSWVCQKIRMPKTITFNITFLFIYKIKHIIKSTKHFEYTEQRLRIWLAGMYFHFKYILWHSKQTRRKKVNIKLKYSLVKLLLFGKLFGAQNTLSIQVRKKTESFHNLITFTCQKYNVGY